MMDKYINHLLADIINAQRLEQSLPEIDPVLVSDEEKMRQYFEEVEHWLEHKPMYTFSYYCGLESELFPPPEKLTHEQLVLVNKAYRQLLFSWNLDADIPENLPAMIQYKLLISTLDKKTDIVNDGFITFEFCQYHPPSCVYEAYCTCKDFEEDKGNDLQEGSQEDELPFS